ncbi:hypothetical protein PYCC9005_005872 [Savitreella phatthalungensis]
MQRPGAGSIDNGSDGGYGTRSSPTLSDSQGNNAGSDVLRRRVKAHVASACVNCKRAHLACDSQRPCHRCISIGKADQCFDVAHKRRGRPRTKEGSGSMSAAGTIIVASSTGNNSNRPATRSPSYDLGNVYSQSLPNGPGGPLRTSPTTQSGLINPYAIARHSTGTLGSMIPSPKHTSTSLPPLTDHGHRFYGAVPAPTVSGPVHGFDFHGSDRSLPAIPTTVDLGCFLVSLRLTIMRAHDYASQTHMLGFPLETMIGRRLQGLLATPHDSTAHRLDTLEAELRSEAQSLGLPPADDPRADDGLSRALAPHHPHEALPNHLARPLPAARFKCFRIVLANVEHRPAACQLSVCLAAESVRLGAYAVVQVRLLDETKPIWGAGGHAGPNANMSLSSGHRPR